MQAHFDASRTLATIQKRQDKELGKIQSQDDELPAILARKDAEISVYAKQAKVYKDKWVALDKDLKKYQRQLQVGTNTPSPRFCASPLNFAGIQG